MSPGGRATTGIRVCLLSVAKCRGSISAFLTDCSASDHELAMPVIMDGFGMFLRRVFPCLNHFKDEEVVSVDESSVNHLAFKIRFSHQRRRHFLGRSGRSVRRPQICRGRDRSSCRSHNPPAGANPFTESRHLEAFHAAGRGRYHFAPA